MLFPNTSVLIHQDLHSSVLSFLPKPGFHSLFYLLVVWKVGSFGGFLFKPMSVIRFLNRNKSDRAEGNTHSRLRNLPFHQTAKNLLASQSLVLHMMKIIEKTQYDQQESTTKRGTDKNQQKGSIHCKPQVVWKDNGISSVSKEKRSQEPSNI